MDAPGPPRTPRWVKAFAVIVLVLVIGFVVLLVSGGDHGPGRHTGSGDPAVAGEHAPPPGGHTR